MRNTSYHVEATTYEGDQVPSALLTGLLVLNPLRKPDRTVVEKTIYQNILHINKEKRLKLGQPK